MFNFENKRKMKKIVLVCIVAIMATAAQAQIYGLSLKTWGN